MGRVRWWRPYSRYVALGAGHTVGLGDPDGTGGHRGWADRFAELLGAVGSDVRYANLAVAGDRMVRVRTRQVPAAAALHPDLVTVLVGAAELRRPRFDLATMVDDLDETLIRLVASGATVVTFTLPDLGDVVAAARPLSTRLYGLNDEVRELAEDHGVVLVDLEQAEVLRHPLVWTEDRRHLNPLGHDLVARAVAQALALPGADGSWRDPLPPVSRTGFRSMVTELRWLTGSPAARVDREAKRPDLLPVLA
ncbi:SGNH/GDSL hydrolase family protein [Nocardia takedensis]|uniref:SGNH/GDSL hydrolase family protein n=1 Tax=Nocardia takedensis TaxID=259390 RepID=UPI0002D665D1|nr:SGNH/GDSL hydrolase family protein [Nocardia takedensis]